MRRRPGVIAGWTLVLSVAALLASGGADLAGAEEPYPAHPRLFAFGTVGIARGQTARVNVVSVGPRTAIPIEIVFFDQEGRALARANRTVRPGHVVFLELPFTQRDEAPDNRLAAYAVVRLERRPDRGYVIPTLEVIDDVTGVTTLLFVDPEG